MPGDVFRMALLGDQFVFGRVVRTDASWTRGGGGGPAQLLYVYDEVSARSEPPENLSPNRLLIPPALTNRLAWSRGYFQTVAHRPLRPDDVLPQHHFRDSRGVIYDDFGREVQSAREPVGVWGLHSYRTIDDAVSQALGIPLAPD